jgi:uncharacterized protein YggE
MPQPAASPIAEERTVTVVGIGTASAAPDTALLHLGVETQGATPAEALDGCSHALEQVVAALHTQGVEPARIATSGLEVHQDWEAAERGQQPAGYRATVRLNARLVEPARAGQVAAAAITAGGDTARVQGLTLVVGDQARLLAVAREEAWRDARARAEQYAALAGAGLGWVLRIEEPGAPQGPRVMPVGDFARAAAVAPGPPVELGETPVWATVTVTWTLAEPPEPGAGEQA